MSTQVQDLLTFIDVSPSPWHAVQSIETRLAAHSFEKLSEQCAWVLQSGGRYYVTRDDASIIAFVVGQKPLLDTGFKIIGAHTDSPGLRVKPNPAMANDNLLRLSVDIYGGPILATFADRELSLAGRVSYKNEHGNIATRLIHIDRPLLRLPNLAIHINRGVNDEGLKLQKQNELPLILTQLAEAQLAPSRFTTLLAEASNLDAKRILSWDLAVCDTQKGNFWGANNEFYANSQLDNLASCHTATQALLHETTLNADSTVVCAFFDHEEVGSESYKGAAGNFLADVLQRVAFATAIDTADLSRVFAKSFLISADMAHAYHPNFPGGYDANHKALVNQGPVIKINANHRYTSDSVSVAHFANWCERANVPYQQYSHRCDLPCGTTIGPITSAKLGIRAVDVGNPMWAMHSLRESAGVLDHDYMIRVMKQFFS